MLDRLTTPASRQWLYGIVVAALPVLVVLGLVNSEDVALWLALAGAVLGIGATGTAFAAITKQRKDGTLQ